MNIAKANKGAGHHLIAQNKKAFHEYFIHETFEAGLALQGWEVKSLREGRAQLVDSYVIIRSGEVFLLGTHITPLKTVSTHFLPDPTRTRKLLLHRDQISRLIGSVEQKGFSLVPLKIYFKKGRVKIEIALAKGKKDRDKRETLKEKDWERQKARIMRENIRRG